MKHYKVNDVAKISGFTPATIRHYDKIGLLEPIRGSSGYRLFNKSDIEKLYFINNAKQAGFTLSEIKKIFGFHKTKKNKSIVIKNMIDKRVSLINQQLKNLQSIKKTLSDLSKICDGTKTIDTCPILLRMFKK